MHILQNFYDLIFKNKNDKMSLPPSVIEKKSFSVLILYSLIANRNEQQIYTLARFLMVPNVSIYNKMVLNSFLNKLICLS